MRTAPRLLGRRAECEALDRLLADALAGESRVIVLRGEAGVGKSALLGHLSDRAGGWRVARAVGVESEIELAHSGLHQLCAPMLDHLDRLPAPQRDALATVFGRSTGPPPDRFLVGLATLTLLAEVAEQQPLVCIVDDAQWLDHASVQILAFVARRLLAERVAIVCAARTGAGDEVLAGLPELSLQGLGDADARALLLDNVRGPLDAAVCDQIITESRGNPLALLELPRTWKVADLAGGFGLPGGQPATSKIEQSYARRVLQLPADTRMLVLAAAAEPLGDPVLLYRAAETLGLGAASADPAVDAGLLRVGGRVEFAHPLVRSAVYSSAAADDRHRVHRALADATDAEHGSRSPRLAPRPGGARTRRGRRRGPRAFGGPGTGARWSRRRGRVPRTGGGAHPRTGATCREGAGGGAEQLPRGSTGPGAATPLHRARGAARRARRRPRATPARPDRVRHHTRPGGSAPAARRGPAARVPGSGPCARDVPRCVRRGGVRGTIGPERRCPRDRGGGARGGVGRHPFGRARAPAICSSTASRISRRTAMRPGSPG